MKWLLAAPVALLYVTGFVIGALVTALISLPSAMLGLGMQVLGDERAAEALFEHTPVILFMDWYIDLEWHR